MILSQETWWRLPGVTTPSCPSRGASWRSTSSGSATWTGTSRSTVCPSEWSIGATLLLMCRNIDLCQLNYLLLVPSLSGGGDGSTEFQSVTLLLVINIVCTGTNILVQSALSRTFHQDKSWIKHLFP